MDYMYCFMLTIQTLCFWNRIIPCPMLKTRLMYTHLWVTDEAAFVAHRLRIALLIEPDTETDCRGFKLIFNARLVPILSLKLSAVYF